MNQDNFLVQLIIGFILFLLVCWFVSNDSNHSYNPEINAGYCSQYECW